MKRKRVPYMALITIAGLMMGWIASTPAQPGPKGKEVTKKGDKKGKKGDEIQVFPDRLERLRRQLEYARPPDQERQTLFWNSGVYANKADQIWRTQQPYIADRTLAAAESLFRASDHLQHLTDASGFPPPPPADDVSRHLAQVYFRTREADFFLQEIHENSASPLVSLSRQYYQRAVQAYDRSDFRGADEYGKTAEEIVKALENLAQAARSRRKPGGELDQQYRDRTSADAPWHELPVAAQDTSLRGVSQAVLRSYPGVEGGYHDGTHFLGYSYPTHDTGGKKQMCRRRNSTTSWRRFRRAAHRAQLSGYCVGNTILL